MLALSTITVPSNELYLAGHLCTCQSACAPPSSPFTPSFGIWLHFHHRTRRNKRSPSPRRHPPFKKEKGRGGGWGDLAKAGGPEAARHPRKVSDRIRSFISEGERGAMEPAVTVGRKKWGNDTNPEPAWRSNVAARPPELCTTACHDLLHPILQRWSGALRCCPVLLGSALFFWSYFSFSSSSSSSDGSAHDLYLAFGPVAQLSTAAWFIKPQPAEAFLLRRH